MNSPLRPNKASVGRAALWSAGGAAASQLVSLAAFLLIARALDPQAFGLVALAALFISLMAVVAEQGFTQALVQRPTLDHAHLHTAFWTNLAFSGALASTLMLGSVSLATALAEPELAPILQVLSLSLILGALSGVQSAILQRAMRFGALTARGFLGTSAGAAVGIGLAWGDLGVWALVAQTLVAQSVTAMGLWSASDWRPQPTFSIHRLQELWSFGLNILGSQLISLINSKTASMFIAALLDKHALGLYTIAARIETTLSSLLVGSITRVSLAALARFQSDHARFRHIYLRGVQLIAALAVPVFVGVSALATEITTAMLGPKWAEAAPILRVLSLAGVVTVVGTFNATAINSLGFPQHNFRLNLLATVVLLPAVVAGSFWGLMGIATGFVARAYLLWPLRFVVLRGLCGVTFRELFASIWGILLSAAVMAATLSSVRNVDAGLDQYSHLAILVGLGALLYTLCLGLFAPAALREAISTGRAALARASSD